MPKIIRFDIPIFCDDLKKRKKVSVKKPIILTLTYIVILNDLQQVSTVARPSLKSYKQKMFKK